MENMDEKLKALREEARERMMKVVEKLGNDPNLVINVEDESPESIVLGVKVIDPETKEFKTYHKGFMKVLKFPDGLSIEEEVERQIRFPEGEIKGD